jgi:hypothetical protein
MTEPKYWAEWSKEELADLDRRGLPVPVIPLLVPDGVALGPARKYLANHKPGSAPLSCEIEDPGPPQAKALQ